MKDLKAEGRPIPIIVLENVSGTITTRNGQDFRILLETLVKDGYRVGPMVINAVHFLPQSRPRLFIIAVRNNYTIPSELLNNGPVVYWNSKALVKTYFDMPEAIINSWIWWKMPLPVPRKLNLIDIIEESPSDVKWHTKEETERLLNLMMPLHQKKVSKAKETQKKVVGTILKRSENNKSGKKVQCAEVRFDGVSGCLRTGSGGSSRQFIIIVEGEKIRTRLLSNREAAKLMGIPDTYQLPTSYNEAYHLIGDGLVVPVSSWIDKTILSPLMNSIKYSETESAYSVDTSDDTSQSKLDSLSLTPLSVRYSHDKCTSILRMIELVAFSSANQTKQ